MCRRYVLVWECDCDYNGEQPVICCPTSDYIQVSPDTPPENRKIVWIEPSVIDIDPRYLECFGTTWDTPIELEMKRTCYDCYLPSDDNTECDLPFELGEERCLENLYPASEGLEYHLAGRERLFDFCDHICWRSPYEESRWWGDSSSSDLEFINLKINSLVEFNRRIKNTREHFKIKTLPRDLGWNMLRAQDLLIFLKKILVYNLLITTDNEASSIRLLTRVPLETLEKEDRECFVCALPFIEEIIDGVAKDAVETPCHHVFCRSCANKWFQDHITCPFCRTSLPSFSYRYPEGDTEREGHPAWLVLLTGNPSWSEFRMLVRGMDNVLGATFVGR